MLNGYIGDNLTELNQQIGNRANLVAVSKTKPNIDIQTAYDFGQRVFGENKIQELLDKSIALATSCPDIKWHFIGHLQSNKINMLLKVQGLESIHSIDSIKLLNKLLPKRLVNNTSRKVGVFLQVNTSLEDQKSGFTNIEDLLEAVTLFKADSSFYFQGLMTIGKIRTDNFEKDARLCFAKLVQTKDELSDKTGLKEIELSMGMSQDYLIALEYQSKWIRVGSKIFGQR